MQKILKKLGEVTALQRLGSKVFVALPQDNLKGCTSLFVLECFFSCGEHFTSELSICSRQESAIFALIFS